MEPTAAVVSPLVKKIIIIGTFVCFTGAAIGIITTVAVLSPEDAIEEQIRGWVCNSKRQCEKFLLKNETDEKVQSLSVCKIFCNDYGGMWPMPTIDFQMGTFLVHLDVNKSSYDVQSGNSEIFILSAVDRFYSHIKNLVPADVEVLKGSAYINITFDIEDMNDINLGLNTDESYKITISLNNDEVNTRIKAHNYFGARHALETLEQFIIFDDLHSKILIPGSLVIHDKPVYPYRGILLDTSRNYFTVESIKHTLDAMAACKLNRFHWHITDSHSFPFYSKTYPEMTRKGVLNPRKVYTPDHIIDIVGYGLERGIRVVPEFDAPAHVGEGWQNTGLTVCFKGEPWTEYCVEPPCGQLDPTQDKLYEVLRGIYKDIFEVFKPDIFHMGGDEVKNECWNSSDKITTWMLNKGWELNDQGFIYLWEYFQKKAQELAYKVNGGKKLPLILWTSTLTEYQHIEEYLSNSDYIIQVWSTGVDPEIKGLLNKGYKLIISNHDALYFDCGFGAWVGEGNNWCSPYIGWQKVYDNSPAKMAGDKKDLILGGEAALWSEQVDTASIDGRLWPRAGALAERLWAEPKTTWRAAERRMLHFRERLVRLGIDADALQPEWCYQNEGHCN